MDSRVRHIAKSVTWRIIATSTTLGVAAFIHKSSADDSPTGHLYGWLAFLDVVIKMLLYYLHERAWFKFKSDLNPRTRHIIKAFSWRIIASLTTFVLVIILFHEMENPLEKGVKIAVFEFFLKMAFYYGHEEAWYRINLGLDNREKKASS